MGHWPEGRAMVEDYRGIPGAYRYAFGESSSRLFRSYVIVSALVGLFVLLLVVLGTVTWIANPTGLIGEQALLPVLGLLVVIPLVVPVLVAARRRRLDVASPGAERVLAATGYLFLLSVYLALLITDPQDHAIGGPLGGIVDVIDSLPRLWGLVPPILGAILLVLATRSTRPDRE